jgi:hypothetical protein
MTDESVFPQDELTNFWSPPGKIIPMFSDMESASEQPIDIKLVYIDVGWMVLEFKQENKEEYAEFDAMLSDPLPKLARLLRLLKQYNYASFWLDSRGTSFYVHAWLGKNEIVYMRICYGETHWDCKIPLTNLLESLRQLSAEILNHPNFVAQYAFWCGEANDEDEKNFWQRCANAWVDYKNGLLPDMPSKVTSLMQEEESLYTDEEEAFEHIWEREHILELPRAVKAYDYYKDLLKF